MKARGAFGTAALILFFTALVHLPMATAVCLLHLSPIFVTILSVLFLGRTVKPLQWLFFAIAGNTLYTRPARR